jgi:hypothetical protein
VVRTDDGRRVCIPAPEVHVVAVAIYLDASVLRVTLQGPEMSSVRVLARAHKQPILIPSIALDEATANRRRAIEKALNDVQVAIKKASWAFIVPEFPRPAPGGPGFVLAEGNADGSRSSACFIGPCR